MLVWRDNGRRRYCILLPAYDVYIRLRETLLYLLAPLICYRLLMCCEIRYNLRKMAAGQDRALFSVKTSPF